MALQDRCDPEFGWSVLPQNLSSFRNRSSLGYPVASRWVSHYFASWLMSLTAPFTLQTNGSPFHLCLLSPCFRGLIRVVHLYLIGPVQLSSFTFFISCLKSLKICSGVIFEMLIPCSSYRDGLANLLSRQDCSFLADQGRRRTFSLRYSHIRFWYF